MTSADAPIHVRMRPTEFVGMGAVGLLLFVGGIALSYAEPIGLALAVLGGVWMVVAFLVGRRLRADVTIGGGSDSGDIIHYRRGKLAFDVHPSRVTRIRVLRTTRRLTTPTVYYLCVRFEGRERELPLAKHWLDGRAALRTAERVAAALGVPVFDPLREKYADSSFPPLRWFARGEEWKLALLAVPVLAALFGIVALVRAVI